MDQFSGSSEEKDECSQSSQIADWLTQPAIPRAIEDAVIASLREGPREFLRFVRRRTNSVENAEDMLQDFYLKAIRSARTIKDPGALKGWLAQVLRSTLADHHRRLDLSKAALARLLVEAEEGRRLRIDDDAERAVYGCLYQISADDARLSARSWSGKWISWISRARELPDSRHLGEQFGCQT